MRRPLSRVVVAILFSALLVVGAVLPAAADGPVYRGPITPSTGTWYLPDACDFPVQMSYSTTNKTETVWIRPDGSVIWQVTGVFRGTMTNLATGYTIELNPGSGLIKETTYPDGSVYLVFVGPTGPPGAAPDYLLRGLERVYITPEGEVSWTFHGHAEYICDLLNP